MRRRRTARQGWACTPVSAIACSSPRAPKSVSLVAAWSQGCTAGGDVRRLCVATRPVHALPGSVHGGAGDCRDGTVRAARTGAGRGVDRRRGGRGYSVRQPTWVCLGDAEAGPPTPRSSGSTSGFATRTTRRSRRFLEQAHADAIVLEDRVGRASRLGSLLPSVSTCGKRPALAATARWFSRGGRWESRAVRRSAARRSRLSIGTARR